MKKQTLLIIAILLSGISIINAQPDTKTISGGILNGKAINLPAPKFPAAAKAVGACGAVNIKVLVDEEGNIFSTETVSGHPLLRSAAEKAAREARFKPTLLSGQPVKVSGILVYVFACDDKKGSTRNSVKEDEANASNSEKQDISLPRRMVFTDSPNGSGQSSGIKTISGGVVNGKALSLPAPTFPLAAKLVRAGGAVAVQVLIDEEGNVLSAKAVSGHPILRSVSEQAALKSKFKPTLLEGNPVKVSGIISYVYNIPMSFIEVGYELARVEKSVANANTFPAFRIEHYLPKDWIQEREDVKKIGDYFKAKEFEKTAPPPETEESKSVEEEKQSSSADIVKTAPVGVSTLPRISATSSGSSRSGSPTMIDFKTFNPGEFSQNLQPKIQNRLSSDEKNLWYFNLGKILGNISAEIEDVEKMQKNAADLKQLVENTPLNVAPQLKEVIAAISEVSGQMLSTEQKTELLSRIRAIKNLSDQGL